MILRSSMLRSVSDNHFLLERFGWLGEAPATVFAMPEGAHRITRLIQILPNVLKLRRKNSENEIFRAVTLVSEKYEKLIGKISGFWVASRVKEICWKYIPAESCSAGHVLSRVYASRGFSRCVLCDRERVKRRHWRAMPGSQAKGAK